MDRYDEALAKARAGKSLEEIFPELKESEDEKIRKWIIEEFKLHYDFESKNLNPMVEKALAWLEKQKEQKPAEWSEEDEKMLQRIIRHTESEYQDWCNDKYGNSEIVSDGKRSCLERLHWLENHFKSLRPQPHWKPSEEQMEWLKSAVILSADKPNIHGTIISLYEQLKRL